MNSTRRVHLVAGVFLLLAVAGEIGMLRVMDHERHRVAARQELYLHSAKVLRRMSLGYTGLLADIYWTRAVQYFGEQHHANNGNFHLLAPLLQITTELDPRLVPAYQFGANFLAPKSPAGAGQPEAALALMKYGIAHNPDQWRLYYNLGFLYFTELKDYAKAADAFAQGAQLPVTSPFMPILAARMAQHAGEFDTARMLWFTTYQTTKEATIKQNAVDHLRALQVDEEVTRLEQLVDKYHEQTGRAPSSMGDLEHAGFIHGTPVDPNDKPYLLTAAGRIEVQDPKSIPFITKGLPPGMATPQPQPVHSDSK
jgi:tetratricopeptide (TPR) repeat protein